MNYDYITKKRTIFEKAKYFTKKNNTYSQGGNTTLRGVGFFRKKEKYQRK